MRTYSELRKLGTFEERFRYLQLNGVVAKETFGSSRFLNQDFYKSMEWKNIRDAVILRDGGCDLGMEGHDIDGMVLVHHMNPVSADDIIHQSDILLNPEYLITTTFRTHNAIHYGDSKLLVMPLAERSKNDTCPWKN